VLEFNSHLLLQESKSEHNGRDLLRRWRALKVVSVITAMLLGSNENKENVHGSEFNVLVTVIITSFKCRRMGGECGTYGTEGKCKYSVGEDN
jgi:hypothetical protein